jgi:hypothetical protein
MMLDWSDYIWIGFIAAMVIYGLWWRKKYY